MTRIANCRERLPVVSLTRSIINWVMYRIISVSDKTWLVPWNMLIMTGRFIPWDKKLDKPASEIDIFKQRANNYKNVYDPKYKLMVGRSDKGEFNPSFKGTDWSVISARVIAGIGVSVFSTTRKVLST